MKLLDKISTNKNVTIIAKTIPEIPKKLPCLDVSGDDNPLRAKINNTPEIKYNDADKFGVITLLYFALLFPFFYTFATFFALPKNHQIYLLRQALLL